MTEQRDLSPRASGAVRRAAPPGLHVGVPLAVGAGGALGTGARYELLEILPVHAGNVPWTTLAINVAGSFVLGALLTLVLERWPPTRFVRPFAAIGFLGAFTTFSTLAVESDLLVKDGHLAPGVVYDVLSLTGGLVAAFVGIVTCRARPPRGGRRLR